MSETISNPQLRRLQTLYATYCSRELGADSSRQARLVWASHNVARSISSFSDLTHTEGNSLIDLLQTTIGQAFVPPASAKARARRRLDRDAARAAGTEGRRDRSANVATMASSADLARVQDAIARLGWTEAHLDAWLRSSSSPLKNRMTPAIRTLGDANRVWWALKHMLQRAGKWGACRGGEQLKQNRADENVSPCFC